MKASWTLGLVFFVWGTLPACGDPCQQLANNICNCYPTMALQSACVAKVSALVSQRHNDADAAAEKAGRNYCASLIDQCTCETLAKGGFKACGLSTE